VRRKSFLALIPAILAAALLASPPPVAAAGGITEAAHTTYVVDTTSSRIDVRIDISITNDMPSTTVPCGWNSTCTQDYYWDTTNIAVEAQAGTLKATSNAGSVKQTLNQADKWYRYIKLTYPPVFYRQTRSITVTYSIGGAPHAAGEYRALKAYTNLCAVGNGVDAGWVKVVIPHGFDVSFYAGSGEMTLESDTGGLQTYTSGDLTSPYKYWTCLDGANSDNLVESGPIVAGGQSFSILSWPEDPTWAAKLESEIESDFPALEQMTGLEQPGGTITVQEVGNTQLGEYAGAYDSTARTAFVTEETDAATVAHELSHIFFNRNLFDATWASEGFAVYSEKVAGPGEFEACTAPGAYPGAGSPDLADWVYLDISSTAQDEAVVDYQYSAACYIVTQLTEKIGPANLRSVLAAAADGEMAYQGATPGERTSASDTPLTSQALLDLIDELGMIPAGVKDLDQAQTLMGQYGIFTADQLADRSKARAVYHSLAAQAGDWKLPLAVREPMASWDFTLAQSEMKILGQVVAARDKVEKSLPGFTLEGGGFQSQFQNATNPGDLGRLQALAEQEADAATVVAQARRQQSGGQNPLQIVGLVGTDLSGQLDQAMAELRAARPEEARTTAQGVIDRVNDATLQGLVRLVVLLALIAAGALLALFVRRRLARPAATPVAAAAIAPATGIMPSEDVAPAADISAAGLTGPLASGFAARYTVSDEPVASPEPRPATHSDAGPEPGAPTPPAAPTAPGAEASSGAPPEPPA
jgi:hypothetical protein